MNGDMKRPTLVVVTLTLIVLGCTKEDPIAPENSSNGPTPFDLHLPQWVIDSLGPMPQPADNPLTVEGVALGRHLFHDKAVSDDLSMSCATCHVQASGFSDPRQFSVGTDGSVGGRNAMAIINLGWSEALFWDGRRQTLEGQAHDPVTNPIEMRNTWPVVEQRIRNMSHYPPLFEAAFGSPDVDSLRIMKAIAQFERTLVSFGSRFDAYYYGGDTTVLTAQEKRGMDLFVGRALCSTCHPLGLFSDDAMRNNGLDLVITDPGAGDVTGQSTDLGKFKVTTLRNICVTGRYMHDGRFIDLQSITQFYNTHVQLNSPNLDPNVQPLASNPGTISLPEQQDLIAFMNTLTDMDFLTNPEFSEP